MAPATPPTDRRRDQPSRRAQIDTTAPTSPRSTESPASGDLNAGKTVTLTLNLSEAVTVDRRHPDADPQRWRHRHLHRRLRHQCAHLQLHGRRRTEHLRPRRHRRQSQLRHHHRRRRQCRQPVAHRPDPERPADRHHNADSLVGGGLASKRRSQSPARPSRLTSTSARQ